VFDINGKNIAQLINEYQVAGEHLVFWDGSTYPSGIYFYQLRTGDRVNTRKMVLLK